MSCSTKCGVIRTIHPPGQWIITFSSSVRSWKKIPPVPCISARFMVWDTSSFVDSLEPVFETASQHASKYVRSRSSAPASPADAFSPLHAADHGGAYDYQPASGAPQR